MTRDSFDRAHALDNFQPMLDALKKMRGWLYERGWWVALSPEEQASINDVIANAEANLKE